MKRMLLGVIVAVMIIGLAFYFSCNQPRRVRIGHLPIAMHAPLFVAQDKGYFSDQNLNVEIVEYPSSDLLIKALLSDQIDVGYELGIDVVFNALVSDPSTLKIYQVSLSYKDAPSDYILIPTDSQITNLADLKGKQLGLFPGPTARAFIKLALDDAAHIDITKDLISTSLPPTVQIDSLASKKIDALFTYEPWASEAIVAQKAKILQAGPVEGHVINPWPGGVGVITKYFLAKNPKAAELVVEALYRAFDTITKDPSIGQEVLSKKFNLSPEVAKRIYLTKHWITYPSPVAGDNELINRPHMDKLLQILSSENVVTGTVATSGIYFEPSK